MTLRVLRHPLRPARPARNRGKGTLSATHEKSARGVSSRLGVPVLNQPGARGRVGLRDDASHRRKSALDSGSSSPGEPALDDAVVPPRDGAVERSTGRV
jgi:hypothetical protein